MSEILKNLPTIKRILAEFYAVEGNERVGFVKGNEIVEVGNYAEKPQEGFMISASDIRYFTEDNPYEATWHTHPGQDSNLSGEDYDMFYNWPDLMHFIIGLDGVRLYKYDETKKTVVEIE